MVSWIYPHSLRDRAWDYESQDRGASPRGGATSCRFDPCRLYHISVAKRIKALVS